MARFTHYRRANNPLDYEADRMVSSGSWVTLFKRKSRWGAWEEVVHFALHEMDEHVVRQDAEVKYGSNGLPLSKAEMGRV